MTGFSFADFAPALPEIMLAGGALVLVLIGAIGGDRMERLINSLAVALLISTGVFVFMQPSATVSAFGGSFTWDAFAQFLKVLTLAGALIALVMSTNYWRLEKVNRFEFPILIVLATAGMFVMISASDLLALYLGLEMQSLALYVIAAIHRDNLRSTEAGLKYFVLGALSSGMLLYGCSLVYGYSGTITFAGIAQSVAGAPSIGMIFGLVFVLAGLAFKVSAVPFHMWTPDVYEGAPTPVTAFFASAPKVAAMAIFIRIVIEGFPQIAHEWRQIVVFLSIASMFLGAFGAIGQTNIKRLMAYSSIANVGFMLVGLAAGTAQGVQSVLIYLAIYVVMTLGTFAVILGMRHKNGGLVENIEDLAGLSRTSPFMAFVMSMMMFSLAGIPPLAGFFAKFYVFLAAIQAELYWLAVLGVLSSVIGAYYYLRIVKIMYFDEPKTPFERLPFELGAVIAVTGGLVVFYWLFPAPVAAAANAAALSLF